MEASGGSSPVRLPPGVKIGPGVESSATNQQNQVVQGMKFPVTTPNGSTTTVFIPYTDLGNTPKVQADIAARVTAIEAIAS